MDWFASWFNSPYYPILYQHRDESEAKQFIANVLDYLGLVPNARLLDLACGQGRHSIELARHGLEVVGADLAEASIEIARRSETDRLQFFVHDMRAPFDFLGGRACAAAFSLFTSFGYFQTEDEHLQTLRNIHAALESGGRLVLDFFNAERVIQQLVLSETKTLQGVDFELRRRVENGRILKEIALRDAARPELGWQSYREEVWGFVRAHLERLLQQAGLEVQAVFGDYALSPFDAVRSERCVLVCVKR